MQREENLGAPIDRSIHKKIEFMARWWYHANPVAEITPRTGQNQWAQVTFH